MTKKGGSGEDNKKGESVGDEGMSGSDDCCFVGNRKKTCRRKDGKMFGLPRRFTRKKCLTMKVRGFSMKSSCAPYKYCKRKTLKLKLKLKGGRGRRRGSGRGRRRGNGTLKQSFLFNPDDPSKSFDVYIDKNPNDTIPIKYKTVDDVKHTIKKLEKLYKAGKYTHKRIWQVGMIMYVRLKVYYDGKGRGKDRKVSQYKLAKRYFKFLGKRTKVIGDANRMKMRFELS